MMLIEESRQTSGRSRRTVDSYLHLHPQTTGISYNRLTSMFVLNSMGWGNIFGPTPFIAFTIHRIHTIHSSSFIKKKRTNRIDALNIFATSKSVNYFLEVMKDAVLSIST